MPPTATKEKEKKRARETTDDDEKTTPASGNGTTKDNAQDMKMMRLALLRNLHAKSKAACEVSMTQNSVDPNQKQGATIRHPAGRMLVMGANREGDRITFSGALSAVTSQGTTGVGSKPGDFNVWTLVQHPRTPEQVTNMKAGDRKLEGVDTALVPFGPVVNLSMRIVGDPAVLNDYMKHVLIPGNEVDIYGISAKVEKEGKWQGSVFVDAKVEKYKPETTKKFDKICKGEVINRVAANEYVNTSSFRNCAVLLQPFIDELRSGGPCAAQCVDLTQSMCKDGNDVVASNVKASFEQMEDPRASTLVKAKYYIASGDNAKLHALFGQIGTDDDVERRAKRLEGFMRAVPEARVFGVEYDETFFDDLSSNRVLGTKKALSMAYDEECSSLEVKQIEPYPLALKRTAFIFVLPIPIDKDIDGTERITSLTSGLKVPSNFMDAEMTGLSIEKKLVKCKWGFNVVKGASGVHDALYQANDSSGYINTGRSVFCTKWMLYEMACFFGTRWQPDLVMLIDVLWKKTRMTFGIEIFDETVTGGEMQETFTTGRTVVDIPTTLSRYGAEVSKKFVVETFLGGDTMCEKRQEIQEGSTFNPLCIDPPTTCRTPMSDMAKDGFVNLREYTGSLKGIETAAGVKAGTPNTVCFFVVYEGMMHPHKSTDDNELAVSSLEDTNKAVVFAVSSAAIVDMPDLMCD